MIKLFLLNPRNGTAVTTLEQVITENNAAIVAAFEDVVSRAGGEDSQPNFMLSDLDLNGHRLLNPGPGTGSDNEFITRGEVAELQSGVFRVNPDTQDLEFSNGGSYTTLFTFDQLRGEQGEPGSDGISGNGSGDLVALLNLSDVADVPTARQNLGLEVGVDVAAHNPLLVGFNPDTKADVDDVNNKADINDPRFERYIIQTFSSDRIIDSWGRLYRSATASPTNLTVTAAEDGCVNSLYVPSDSGNVTLVPDTGVTLYVAGETVERPIVITGGGYVSITCIRTNGRRFVVSGSGIQLQQ